MRRLGAEAPHLVEGGLEPVEHLVEQPREVGNLILHRGDGDAFAEIVRADVAGRFLDEPHRAQRHAAEPEADAPAGDDHHHGQPGKDLDVALHHRAGLLRGGGDHHVHLAEQEFAHPEPADLVDLDVEDPLARDVGDGLPAQVARAEDGAGALLVDLDVEQHGGEFGGLPDALVDLAGLQLVVVGPEPGLDLRELRGVQQVQPVHQVVLEQVIAGEEQAGDGGRRGQRIPHREARPDGFHGMSW